MPFLHGRNTHVYLGSGDLSPYLNSVDFAVDMETADTSVFGTSWKSSVVGIPGAKIDFGGLYDPGQVTLTDLFQTNALGVLTVCPGAGLTVGDRARLATVLETSYSESPPVGGAVGIKGSWLADGAVGYGDILHPLVEDTNTTVGTEKDDAAATSTGWTAHLHVTAIDGGTWTIKLEDAAISNTYADVTGGAFTAIAAPGSQRIQSALVTTALRRYVRYTATRAGGVAGNGITFVVAYARTR